MHRSLEAEANRKEFTMHKILETDPLRLGFEPVDIRNIPVILSPLIEDVIDCYKRHHPDLQSICLIGSATNGEWKPGISDLDVIGITNAHPSIENEHSRREELVILGEKSPHITFLDNNVLSLSTLSTTSDPTSVGMARFIEISGLNVWGQKPDFREYLPTIGDMARDRAVRAEALMRKYRAGDLIESFHRDERLLVRSCAKVAMRVLSSIAILRGALFYISPIQTYATVEQLVPEAMAIAQQTLAIIRGEQSTVSKAMSLTDQALELFEELCPNS